MSSFEISSRVVLQRSARFRHRRHDDASQYGPSLRYLAMADLWDGEGLDLDELGRAGDWHCWLDNPLLTDDGMEWWKGVWDQFSYRRLPPSIGVKVLDIGANMATPRQAHLVLLRALLAVGYPRASDPPETLSEAAIAAMRDALMRGNESALVAAMRCEQAALYRAVAAANEDLRVHLPGWLRHAYC
jgi:hypothetical protein